MIKLTQLIKELGINDPNKLVKGKKYQVWNKYIEEWMVLIFRYEDDETLYFKYPNYMVGDMAFSRYDFDQNRNWVKPYNEKINELSVNKPSEFYKFKKGGEYVVTYDLGDEEIYHFPLRIASIDSGGCCIALHIGRENIDYNDQQDVDNYGFTLCKEDVIKVEPYTPNNNIYELSVNKPGKLNRLKIGKVYKITYNIDAYSDGNNEDDNITDNLKILNIQSDKHGLCAETIPITEEDNPDDFLLFLWEENIIKIEPYVVNELQINNPNVTKKEVEEFWDGNIFLNQNYRDLKKKYCLEYSVNSSVDTETLIQILPQVGLNRFYKDLKELYNQQQMQYDPNDLIELQVNKPEPNSKLFRLLDANKTEVWNKILKKQYKEYVSAYNFNPEKDIEFELGDWSGEKEANVVNLELFPNSNYGDSMGWEASIDAKYFNIRNDENINIKEANIKGLKFYYITYNT